MKDLLKRIEALEREVFSGKKIVVTDRKFNLLSTEWTILDTVGDGMLCIADRLPSARPFGNDCNKWNQCGLRNFLNDEFCPLLEKEVGAANIIPYKRYLQSISNEVPAAECYDSVSVISTGEYYKYQHLIPNGHFFWWTLTPYSVELGNSVAVIDPMGNIYELDVSANVNVFVRPLVLLNKTIFTIEDGRKDT